jgi:hypothetical protein
MTVYQINPLRDQRWAEFVKIHPRASIFHTPGWFESLQRTYGYDPIVVTTSGPQTPLTNGLPFCRVKSWVTGERVVSLPFSDHCEPLVDSELELRAMLEFMAEQCRERGNRYVEIRPLEHRDVYLGEQFPYRHAEEFRLPLIDLRPTLDELFQSFDKSSTQRSIRHGEKLGLNYEEGTSSGLLKKFYALQVLTRRRHQLPPQPLKWFQNLLALLGDKAKIRLISRGERPVASILTVLFKDTMLYKYGCSDPELNNLRGTTVLFWRTIQDAKEHGAQVFDLGRSDLDNKGLLRFKSQWGGKEIPLIYWRYPQGVRDIVPRFSIGKRLGRKMLAHLPDNLLILVGKTLYKHAG